MRVQCLPLSPCLKIWVQICPFLAGPSWCLGTPGDTESGPGGGKTSRIGVSVMELWFRVAPQAGSLWNAEMPELIAGVKRKKKEKERGENRIFSRICSVFLKIS